MTFRGVTAWGLIAGLRLGEMAPLSPGFVCDLFVLRRQYDDEQHGVRRASGDNEELSWTDEEA